MTWTGSARIFDSRIAGKDTASGLADHPAGLMSGAPTGQPYPVGSETARGRWEAAGCYERSAGLASVDVLNSFSP